MMSNTENSQTIMMGPPSHGQGFSSSQQANSGSGPNHMQPSGIQQGAPGSQSSQPPPGSHHPQMSHSAGPNMPQLQGVPMPPENNMEKLQKVSDKACLKIFLLQVARLGGTKNR